MERANGRTSSSTSQLQTANVTSKLTRIITASLFAKITRRYLATCSASDINSHAENPGPSVAVCVALSTAAGKTRAEARRDRRRERATLLHNNNLAWRECAAFSQFLKTAAQASLIARNVITGVPRTCVRMHRSLGACVSPF